MLFVESAMKASSLYRNWIAHRGASNPPLTMNGSNIITYLFLFYNNIAPGGWREGGFPSPKEFPVSGELTEVMGYLSDRTRQWTK
jgi:hypothetical protein